MAKDAYQFGIIGAGMIAEVHAQALANMPNAEMVAVCTRRLEQAEAFASKHGCKAYDHLDAMLAHDGLDIVTLCTPSGAHLEPAVAAAEAGKHVIVEKPLEVTLERIDKMVAACDANNVMLCGILPRRFMRSTQLCKQAIDQGRFGKLTLAEASVKWWRPQSYYDSGAWRGTWELDGGGALMNQSIHTVDLLLHLMGDVQRVSGFAGCAAHTNIEVEDVAVAILEFTNGARGVIQGSTACWSAAGHPAQVQICGTAGSAFMADDRFSVWEFADPQPEDAKVLEMYGVNADAAGAGAADPTAINFTWHQHNFEEAVAALREDRPPTLGGAESRKAVEVIAAIYASAAQGGQPITLT